MINSRYKIIRKLGEGRSTVYLCSDIEFPGKQYAIKILPKGIDDKEVKSFIKEYFILKKLEHPNIIRPFGLGAVVSVDKDDEIEIGSSFITLEYFDGKKLLNSREIYEEANLREILKQICSVLYYLHQSKYIYYDLKPENILTSFDGDKPQIKLIDLGLAEYSPSTTNYEVKGTAYYIAPELLRKENHNHSVDLYSLGIILYQIIYNCFPFDAQNELDIYKAAVDSEFKFPHATNYSPKIINITKKLLEKDLTIRYSSALAVIKDLGFPIDLSITKEFLPAKVFSSRNYTVNVLSKYISDKSSSEVFTVKGFDGVGKTSLLSKMQEYYPQAIFISDIKIKTGAELVRYILRKIIFSISVFPHLSEKEKSLVISLMNKSEEEIIDDLRSIMILISAKNKFILLIDDFNLFDQLTIDLLLEVIPFLQVNGIKVIISESSEHNFLSSKINNVREVNLGPFTVEEMTQMLEESFSSEFPKKEIHNLILSYSDLIPGNIKSFIKDLILLGIMKFSEMGISFSDEEDKLSILKKAHFAIYDLRLANLLEIELKAVKILAALDTYIDAGVLSILLGLSEMETGKIILDLQLNNIVQEYTSGQTIIFTSEAIKKHIYATIEDKQKIHLHIANILSSKVPSTNRLEIARQYELAAEYEISFNVLMTEVNESEKHSAFEYIRKILTHLLDLPLRKKMKDAVMIKLSEVFYKLGDMQSALGTLKELKGTVSEKELDKKLFLIEGSALIASGEFETGKKVINNLLNEMDNIDEVQKLKVELAYADFELKRYGEAKQQCDLLLNDTKLSPESKGRCYNLKGMIDIYQNNEMDSALENFRRAKQEFDKANEPIRISGAEVNIGNIYNILADYEKAEEHWKTALEINQSIGNLDQEGLLHQNFGLFYLDRQKYNLAIESYLKAQKIFLSLGKESNYGLILINLGEVYLKICDYQKSIESLKEAYKIFSRLNNPEEVLESLTLLGKLFFSIGFLLKLEETILSFEKFISSVNLPAKYKTNLKYLKILLKLLKEEKNFPDDINKVVLEYKKLEERNLMIECKFLMISCLIREENFKAAYDELFDIELMDLCSQNSILAAEREYFLGIVSRNYKSDQLLPALTYFENAYELIKDENIAELTWKILYSISDLYIERGNLNKAKQFVVYTRELIYFIAEKIESPRLRAAYLKQKDRKKTLEKLENFYPA